MRPRAFAAGLLVTLAAALGATPAAEANFGFLPGAAGFEVKVEKEGGSAITQAGAHPGLLRVKAGMNTAGGASDGDLRDLRLSLPPSFLINPTAISECSAAAFATPRVSPNETSASGESCPNSSQVGVARVEVGGTVRYFGVFNLVPSFGTPVAIGFAPFGHGVILKARLREADVGFDLETEGFPQALDLQGLELTIWGTPWQGAHDGERGNCLNEQTGGSFGSCLVFDAAGAPGELIKSILTLPTTPCGAPLAFAANATSWQGASAAAGAETAALEKCVKHLTTPKAQLMTAAAAARTGLAFNLDVNDGGGILNPGGLARPAIKKAIVSLPEGLTINPSVGAGLASCSEAEFAREAPTSEPGAGCPNPTKIGTVVLEGTLGLEEPLIGSVFVAKPYENPFGTLLAVYMVVRSARRGLMVKSVGKIESNPTSGQLVATFDQLPQLLYTHFTLTLREGQRSVLVSPPLCGTYPTDIAISSWAEPETFVKNQSIFLINHGEGGAPCPTGGAGPFRPGLLAGSLNPSPAAYTPFYLRMTRTDPEQEITSYSATFPPGLLAKLAGVSECGDAAIEAAKHRSGIEELTTPSCPASSRIGRTTAGYGVGGVLAYAPGGLFLAGPYHGAPLSTVAIDSALIGPFDLGTVIVRSAIRIDPRTAQASIDSAGSDPIPHILKGIPLHLRDIRVYVDRPGFTLNPTSCDPTQVSSALTGAGADLFSAADDSHAGSTQRFQLLGCTGLGFKPGLRIALRGSTHHARLPALQATYTPRPGDANLRSAAVTLPPSLFLEQQHIKTVCTRVQFAAKACPAGSVYGQARAVTPLLDEPLEGPVYLRSSATAVPDLVASLSGRGIAIEVVGRIDSAHGGIRASFEGLPDGPVTSFTLSLPGGKRGLLVNGEDLCRKPQRANARFIGQSNATEVLRPKLAMKCRKHRAQGKRR